jgi:radical SAM superfamily enzyme YgiQ (UPF0313 family)
VRILLVSLNRESAPYPVAPLGLAYVAGAARRAGHRVALLDLCFSADVEGDIARAVHGGRPDLIGVSIRNVDNLTYPASVSYLTEMQAAIAALRRAACGTPIVAGGSGFSIFPDRLLSLLDLDLGVVGEGEETFCRLAAALEAGRPLPALPDLVRPGEPASGSSRHEAGFAGQGPPARDLLDNRAYLSLGGMANVQTKRGCPFRCAYCTYPYIDGRSLRLRQAGDVAEELAGMLDRQLDEVFFVDDIFNWPANHAMEICEAILARRLPVRWTCFGTPAGMTSELARTMRRAGCRGVEFGVDTASPAVLRALDKPFPADEIRSAALACREAGLPAAYYLVFGGPGETLETMHETFQALESLRPQAVLAFLGVRIYPHTRLHQMALAEGVLRGDEDLLSPRFYLSPGVDSETLQAAVAAEARRQPNWIVPGLGIRSDPGLLAALRRGGRRGPLWDLL